MPKGKPNKPCDLALVTDAMNLLRKVVEELDSPDYDGAISTATYLELKKIIIRGS